VVVYHIIVILSSYTHHHFSIMCFLCITVAYLWAIMSGPMPENQKYRMRSSELYNLFWNSRYTDPWQMFWREHYIK